ncbi:Fe-S cluster assembly protein SufD [Kaustia mangrovi]|uniref:Fe-S cluster assembly protein SufD n=1 Tax=Kaustia mangrovi TaxID=2593653 RepID=A0A7S8C7B9_9HYPH|nr:Fe-S cluster assembly protein SufD [Kaustia mangrovi]QPC44763.1 Fe-S cluster assembly protein SufD [Kaustia mangrovi]
MNVAVQKTKAEAAFIDAYATRRDALPHAGWLEPKREAAFESFSAHGLPNRRVEEWKWTDLRRHLNEAYPPLVAAEPEAGAVETLLARDPFAQIGRKRLVFVDGRFDAGLSDAQDLDGVEVHALSDVMADPPSWAREILGNLFGAGRDPVAELNTVFLADGALVRIADGAEIATPLALVFVNAGTAPRMTAVRNVVAVGAGARATILETHLGSGPYLADIVTETVVGKGAELERVRVQADDTEAVQLSNAHIELEADAVLRDVTLTMGGRLTRNQLFVKYRGEGADAHIAGSYLLAGNQHCDTTMVVNHAVPSCQSRELFKCVMDDTAHGVFQGKIMVAPEAQKTDGKQQSHGLLLSERAEFDSKPELEIFADDVACGHGATSGALDDRLIFYLRARGIPEAQAKSLLIAAFVREAFDDIAHEGARDVLAGLAEGWLAERKGGIDG